MAKRTDLGAVSTSLPWWSPVRANCSSEPPKHGGRRTAPGSPSGWPPPWPDTGASRSACSLSSWRLPSSFREGKPWLKHRQHAADQRMTHNVRIAQADDRNLRDLLQPGRDVAQPRKASEQVCLIGIACQHHGRPPTEPGEQHFELAIGAVLRLVDNHETAIKCASSHVGDWRYLDSAIRQ